MNEEKFQALYKNAKKKEIIKELYFKCKANYELENIRKEAKEKIEELAEDDGEFIGEIDKGRKVELLEILEKVGDEK